MITEVAKAQSALMIKRSISQARTEEILNDADIITLLEKIIADLKAQA